VTQAGKGFLVTLTAVAVFLFGGCATLPGTPVERDVAPATADREIPEQELLNVTIAVFDPGELPEDEEERKGLNDDIRTAEANYLPVHLKNTMQSSGYWGAIWVVPEIAPGAELAVTGRVEYSDGESLALHVRAVDARGAVWLDKTYAETAEAAEFSGTSPGGDDIFQDLFNAAANDLAAYRDKLAPREIATIRGVAETRFAADLAPEAFDRYLDRKKERYALAGLPARDDPMLARVRAVRARDDLLKDTLTGYYDKYYLQIWEPYQQWRQFRADELRTVKDIKKDALTKQVIGALAIVGAVASAMTGDNNSAADTLRAIAVIEGAKAVMGGFAKRREAEMNQAVIEELGQSFSSEAAPLVLEVNGESVRLTGTAKEQYAKWRRLLREIYLAETGNNASLPVIIGREGQSEEREEGP